MFIEYVICTFDANDFYFLSLPKLITFKELDSVA